MSSDSLSSYKSNEDKVLNSIGIDKELPVSNEPFPPLAQQFSSKSLDEKDEEDINFLPLEPGQKPIGKVASDWYIPLPPDQKSIGKSPSESWFRVSLDERTPGMVMRSVFAFYDKNHSGELSKEQFYTLLHKMGIRDNDLKEFMLQLADKDNDGIIKYSDFYKWVRKDRAQRWIRENNRFFTFVIIAKICLELSQDGTKKFTEDEWMNTGRKLEFNEDELKYLWKQIDILQKKDISFQEWFEYIEPVY